MIARIEADVDEMLGDAHAWTSYDFPKLYALGGTAGGEATGSQFIWSQIHQQAVQQLQNGLWNQVLGATNGVKENTKQLVRAVGEDESLQAAIEGRTAKQAATSMRRILESQGMHAVTYSDGSVHTLREYCEMAQRTQSAIAYNLGTLNQAETAGVVYWEVIDGPACGWTYHDDTTLASGLIVTKDDAMAWPMSHPNCRRTFGARPDITSKKAAKAARGGQVTPSQVEAQMAQDRAQPGLRGLAHQLDQEKRGLWKAPVSSLQDALPSGSVSAPRALSGAERAALSEYDGRYRLPVDQALMDQAMVNGPLPADIDALTLQLDEAVAASRLRGSATLYRDLDGLPDWMDPALVVSPETALAGQVMRGPGYLSLAREANGDTTGWTMAVSVPKGTAALERPGEVLLGRDTGLRILEVDTKNRRLITELTDEPATIGTRAQFVQHQVEVYDAQMAELGPRWFSKKWDALGVDSQIQEQGNVWTLNKLVIPKDARKEGLGTAFMEELTRMADRQGATLALTPSTSYGATSVARLKRFYSRFGFSKNKDFEISESMSRAGRGVDKTEEAKAELAAVRIRRGEALKRLEQPMQMPHATNDPFTAHLLQVPTLKTVQNATMDASEMPEVAAWLAAGGPEAQQYVDLINKWSNIDTDASSIGKAALTGSTEDGRTLAAFMDKAPVIDDTLWRGGDFDVSDLHVGDRITMQPSSFSRDQGVAQSYVDTNYMGVEEGSHATLFRVQGGARGLPVDALSAFSSAEAEVITGGVMEITGIEDVLDTGIPQKIVYLTQRAVKPEITKVELTPSELFAAEKERETKKALESFGLHKVIIGNPSVAIEDHTVSETAMFLRPGEPWARRVTMQIAEEDGYVPAYDLPAFGSDYVAPKSFVRYHNGRAYAFEANDPLSDLTPAMRDVYDQRIVAYEKALSEVPDNIAAHSRGVMWAKSANPQDAHWAQQYNMPGFASDATGGSGITTIWGQKEAKPLTVLHELGHTLDTELGGKPGYAFSQTPDWHTIQMSDSHAGQWAYGGVTKPKSVPSMNKLLPGCTSVTDYGVNSVEEDYAESVSLYFADRKMGRIGYTAEGQPVRFSDLFPARAHHFDDRFGLHTDFDTPIKKEHWIKAHDQLAQGINWDKVQYPQVMSALYGLEKDDIATIVAQVDKEVKAGAEFGKIKASEALKALEAEKAALANAQKVTTGAAVVLTDQQQLLLGVMHEWKDQGIDPLSLNIHQTMGKTCNKIELKGIKKADVQAAWKALENEASKAAQIEHLTPVQKAYLQIAQDWKKQQGYDPLEKSVHSVMGKLYKYPEIKGIKKADIEVVHEILSPGAYVSSDVAGAVERAGVRAERGPSLFEPGVKPKYRVAAQKWLDNAGGDADKYVTADGLSIPDWWGQDQRAKHQIVGKMSDRMADDEKTWEAMRRAVREPVLDASGKPQIGSIVASWTKELKPFAETTREERYREMYELNNRTIATWASTSGNAHGYALAMQMAIKDEFGTRGAVWTRDVKALDLANKIYATHGDYYRLFARQMWQDTQDEFAQEGIERISVFRGMRSVGSHDWAQVGAPRDIELQPANSWSTSKATARRFGDTLFEVTVPVDRVLGTARTGFGCFGEQEFVILDTEGKAHLAGRKHGYGNKWVSYTLKEAEAMPAPHAA